jgi:hypothetical protein
MSKAKLIRIELTSAQKEQIKQAFGRDCDTMELTVNELEQRIAPSLFTSCASGSIPPRVSP